MKCKYFEECSAAICPKDERAAQSVWFADEQVCRLQKVPEWVKRQRKIAKTGIETITGYFTLTMLERRCVIGKKMVGIDTDAMDDERKTAEENWLDRHQPVKPKTHIERERLAERMRFLRAIRLETEGEKSESVRWETSAVGKKVKSYGKTAQALLRGLSLHKWAEVKRKCDGLCFE